MLLHREIKFPNNSCSKYPLVQKHWNYLHNFRDDQAAIAAFFSACFLFFAGSPVNVTPANSTVQVKTGWCPRPDLKVVYAGNDAPTLCETSCKRFLYTPVSSYKIMGIWNKKKYHLEAIRKAYSFTTKSKYNIWI